MRLQLLELSGFKSFPNRAELSFEQGVTAIVGPNGCGKSNLVDAITWVLGEQSAKNLRGGRMDDLIFGGSDGRRPTAAAEVRLVLKDVALEAGPNGSRALDPAHRGNGHGTSAAAPGANGGEPGTGDVGGATATATAAAVSGDLGGGADVALDEEPLRRPVARDVELARRLYRSGESEYLIDGHVCRLRDVQDLLMSAGVGVKGYAVIEQGKIGQILSARPTERRQLIEEAAGVTKFKSRRHAAELKLDAARENLARVDDIIHELERQRGALKRQSAKARRYQRLRDQLRVWETVLFASRHRLLLVTLEDAIAALAEARQQEGGVASRMERVEADLERRRADLAAREGAAATAREDAHARELDVRRHQQQIAFDRQQIESLGEAETVLAAEVEALEARRSPQQRALAEQRQVTAEVEGARDDAARRLAEAQEAHAAALRRVTSLESDVEAARGEVFSAINAATALRHAIENAAAGHDRVTEDLDRLGVEAADLALERRRASTQHADASRVLADARAALEATRDRLEHHRRDLESWRRERESAAGDVRALERRVAETEARHRSLEELAIARAGYGDAARLLLAEAQGGVPQLGSLADHVEVDREYERAVEGALDELLEHVLVRSHEAAREGIRLVRDGEAGRCGFIVVESAHGEPGGAEELHRPPEGFVSLASFVTFSGPHAAALRRVIGDFWVAPTFEAAVAVARTSSTPIVTREGDVLRGPHIVRGSGRGSSRGILSTKGEIRRLADRHAEEQRAAEAAAEALARLSARIDEADVTVASLTAELHEQEKLIVGAELQESRAKEEIDRLDRKHALIDTEQRRATEARGALEARRLEAHESIARLESDQRAADERFSLAQQRLIEARGEAERLSVAAAEAKAAHARLTERAVQGSANLSRVERAVDELEERIASRAGDRDQTRARREELVRSVAESERLLAEDRLALDHLAEIVEASDRCVAELHDECQGLEHDLRAVRRELDEARARVARLDVAHATAESDIAHLADSCTQALQASLDDVSAEVARMAEAGELPTWRPSGRGGQRDAEAGADEVGDEAAAEEAAAEEAAAVEAAADEVAAAAERAVASTEFEEADADDPGAVAEQAVADLRERIERLGAINMMAIEQFDELEQRHGFMAAQRQDLVDSISTTGAAIKRIERTTRERFKEAFDQINVNLQETFATMFGGGQAGLVLLDEDDLLESGLDIIAQPPGKRLQSVQLLSGGEKALTAIALMFAIFKYRPSPFCLLDEIDAPLDDVNIGRFVEMLRSMIGHTQFILITHNRRTMEIADRLYGVTMEEPGVSKLVSVALN